jgi:hypothetical protein
MYVNAKMITVETVPGIRGWGRAVEGWNSSMIYFIHCKNLCKCYNVPPNQHNNNNNNKKNEILLFLATWMELKDIMLSEMRQEKKDRYYMFSLICGS